jgi:hypothetical protein
MAEKHVDKRSEKQFDIPEGVDYSWTAESQDEMSRHYEKEHKKGK